MRLLLPLFSHWHLRTVTIRQREHDLEYKRRDWLRRCALEQWHVRFRAQRALSADDGPADRFSQARVARGALRHWRSALREHERRKKISGLTAARDRLVARVDLRAVDSAMRTWRHKAAARVVARKRATNLARAAWYAWQRRQRAVRDREEARAERAEAHLERWDRARAARACEWWIRRTALRVKESADREGKDRRVKTRVWEVWRTKT